MFRNLLKVGALIVVLTLGMTASASAQHYHGGHGHGGHNHGYPTWHNTSHLHYHPGGFQRHGNHFHYVPGHFDVHRTGHWHW